MTPHPAFPDCAGPTRSARGALVLAAALLMAGCGNAPQAENAPRSMAPPPAPPHVLAEGAGAHAHDHDHRAVAGAGHLGHGGHVVEVERAARLEVLQESARRLRVTLGPVPLAPGAGEPVMRVTPGHEAPVGFDGWIVGLDFLLHDAAGNPLPRELLHHVNVLLPDRRDLFRPMMKRLVAAGRETAPMRLPWPLGVRVAAGEEILVVAMLHNESAVPYDGVYISLDFETRRHGRLGVQPFMMDVSPPPAPASWDLPPGRSTRSWEYSPAVDGRILGIGAHLHRYATELVLEDASSGRVLHRSRPVLDDSGEVVGIPHRILMPRGVRLHADRSYRVTAVYDNPTGETIPDGAMGVLGGIFRARSPWPAADRADPLYRQDRAGTFR
jgi:hypothetical protein